MMPDIRLALLAVSDSPAASMAAKATAILALGLAAAGLARGSRAAVRHAVLTAAFGALVALSLASLAAPPLRVALRIAERAAAPLDAPAAGPVVSVAPEQPVAAPAGSPSRRPSSAVLSLAAWSAGAALFLLPAMLGLLHVRRLRRTALPWPKGQAVAEELARAAGIRRRVAVLLHEALAGPMMCGTLHPAIVLPVDARDWREEDIERAIVHELEHLRRGDWALSCLARAVCAAYWFHPLVWMAWRRLALEAERACDDAVLARSEATAYADQLVGVAERLLAASKRPLLAMAGRADLAKRFAAVLDSRLPRGRAGAAPVALACAAAAALVFLVAPLQMVAAPDATADAPILDSARIPMPAAPQTPIAKAPSVRPIVKPAPILMAAAPQAAAAPQSANTPMARFAAGAELVTVDVTASYPNGDAIEGLTASDFVITEDGAPQRIVVFEYQKVESAAPVSSYYVLGYYTGNSSLDGAFRKINVSLKGIPSAKLDCRAGYYAGSGEASVTNDTPGPGVTLPRLLRKVQPEYSEAARKAKFQGAVVLLMTVDIDGAAKNIHVLRSLGLALDEKAVEAVKQWKFIPGMQDLVAVPMQAQVVVTFRLL